MDFSNDNVSEIKIFDDIRRVSSNDKEEKNDRDDKDDRRRRSRRNSIFNETSQQHQEVVKMADKLFSAWDLSNDGVISLEEILFSGLEKEFASALARTLENKNGEIRCDNLIHCLSVLKFGDMKSKVKLFFKFMDQKRNDEVSSEEIQHYMKFTPIEIFEKLGFIGPNRTSKALKFDHVLALFEKSDRGMDAINLFCERIMAVLESRRTEQTGRIRANSFAISASVPTCLRMKIFDDMYEYYRRISHSTFYTCLLVFLQVILWVYNFEYYNETGYPLSFCIAKGFGLNLRIFTLILFFTMARTTMGCFHTLPLLHYLVPLGFNIQIHSFCGFCTIIHAFGHMSGHIAYHTLHVSGGFAHSFEQKSILTGANWRNKMIGDGITGYMLMMTLLIMAWTALNRGNSAKDYKIFSTVHFLYVFWIAVIILHVPNLWQWFFAIGVLMLLDRGYDFLKQTSHYNLSLSRPCANGVTFLSIPRTSPTYPGSVSSHHLTFFVASSGDWTRRLYELVSDVHNRQSISVQVQGPYDAPAKTATKDPSKLSLLVASGIGITPFFSSMASKVTDENNYETDKNIFNDLFDEELGESRKGSFSTINAMKAWNLLSDDMDVDKIQPLHAVWSIREATELMFYIDYVYHLVKYQSHLKKPVVLVDVYLTGLGQKTDPKYMVSQTLFLLSLSSKTSEFMKIHFGRPNLKKIVTDVKPDAVYYCGGKVLKDALGEICVEKNIVFHPEDFDSGTRFLKSVSDYFLAWRKQRHETEERKALIRRKTVVRMNSKQNIV